MITGLAKKNLRSAPAVFGSQQHTESLNFIGVADPYSFLFVDDREESRALLGRGLLKKFSGCTCVECEDSEMAVALLGKVIYAAAVVHRAADADGAAVCHGALLSRRQSAKRGRGRKDHEFEAGLPELKNE